LEWTLPAGDERRALELNEAGWWSNWATIKWYGDDCYALFSDAFREYFFNRASLLSCESAKVRVPELEAEFSARNLRPYLFVGDECRPALASMRASSYSTADKMSVMRLGSPSFKSSDGVTVAEAGPSDHREWARVYLESFYGDASLLPEVLEVLGRLPRGSADLLVARVGGKNAGGLACHRSGGLLGVYCVGTLPQFRRRGVAATLLQRAAETARKEGRDLILQTLESDSVESFYESQGFRRLFSKRLMTKQASREAEGR
jgi:GNAT superfamily N-acetyltransferase